MIREASALRAAARQSLNGNWGGAVVVTLFYLLVYAGVPAAFSIFEEVYHISLGFFGNVLQVLLVPIAFGYAVIYLTLVRTGKECKIQDLFEGFLDYTRIWGTQILMGLYIMLWTLLFIIPGIIKSYSYSLTSYILKDEPELKFNAAIERSMDMMNGHKFDLFYLHLTFIGWGILSLLTLGIGFLWLNPYMMTAQAQFYEDVKAEYQERLGQQPVEKA